MPSETKGDVVLFVILQRKLLSPVFPTIAVVMMDIKESILRSNLTERVNCSICPGFAVKGMNCVHEATSVKFIKADDVSFVQGRNQNEDGEYGNDGESFWNTVYNIGKEDIVNDDTREKGEISYAST